MEETLEKMLTAKSKDVEETNRMEVEAGRASHDWYVYSHGWWMYISTNHYESLSMELDWLIQVSLTSATL